MLAFMPSSCQKSVLILSGRQDGIGVQQRLQPMLKQPGRQVYVSGNAGEDCNCQVGRQVWTLTSTTGNAALIAERLNPALSK